MAGVRLVLLMKVKSAIVAHLTSASALTAVER
jgi:hypothetical protein